MFNRSLWQPLLLFCGALGADRLSKGIAITELTQGPYTVFPGFNLSLALNKGISWSLLSAHSTYSSAALFCMVLAVILLFGWVTVREHQAGNSIVWQSLVLAGALSNLVDRLLYGGVVDFIDFHWGAWHFATFNIADICIVVGISFLVKRIVIDEMGSR